MKSLLKLEIIPKVLMILILFVILSILTGRYLGWNALSSISTFFAAIGTLSAVIWAIYHQEIKTWLQRPRLEFMPFEQEPPFFRDAPEIDQDTGQVAGIGYYINVPIRNIGKTTIKDCEPVVTAMGSPAQGNWQKKKNWLPKPLIWTFRPNEHRILPPRRPIAFALGKISTLHPNKFILRVIYPTTGQPSAFDPGEYCFEVTIFSEQAEPAIKYFYIKWNGGCSSDFDSVRTSAIKISAKDYPPWSTK